MRDANRGARMNINAGAKGGGFAGTAAGMGRFNNQLNRSTSLLGRFAAGLVQIGTHNALAAGAQGTRDAESAALRTRQAGFTAEETQGFVEMSREVQKKFPQIPAADILNSSVEQLAMLKTTNATQAQYQESMERVAKNAQILAVTTGDQARGADQARSLEKLGQIKGLGTDAAAINRLQDAALKQLVASGGDQSAEDAVRMFRQLKPAQIMAMNEEAIGDALAIRDEGGASSSADFRTFMRDMSRASLSKTNKQAMARAGLRDQDLTPNTIASAIAKNPVDATIKYLGPLVEADLKKQGKTIATATAQEVGKSVLNLGSRRPVRRCPRKF